MVVKRLQGGIAMGVMLVWTLVLSVPFFCSGSAVACGQDCKPHPGWVKRFDANRDGKIDEHEFEFIKELTRKFNQVPKGSEHPVPPTAPPPEVHPRPMPKISWDAGELCELFARMAEFFMANGEREKCEAAVLKAVEAQVRYKAAEVLFAAGRIPEAVEQLMSILHIPPLPEEVRRKEAEHRLEMLHQRLQEIQAEKEKLARAVELAQEEFEQEAARLEHELHKKMAEVDVYQNKLHREEEQIEREIAQLRGKLRPVPEHGRRPPEVRRPGRWQWRSELKERLLKRRRQLLEEAREIRHTMERIRHALGEREVSAEDRKELEGKLSRLERRLEEIRRHLHKLEQLQERFRHRQEKKRPRKGEHHMMRTMVF
jgi:tetratricopeptide (TPR) repeat protein